MYKVKITTAFLQVYDCQNCQISLQQMLISPEVQCPHVTMPASALVVND